MTGPVAYSYIRMSSGQQLLGDSLRRQKELSEKYAAMKGLQLATTAEYQDLGVSAFKGANVTGGALGRFVEAAEKGKIAKGSYLLVESFDRISRAALNQALSTFLRIVNAGVILVTLADQREYRENFDFNDILYSLLSMVRANEESEMKSKRVGAAWREKKKNAAAKPVSKICPAWLEPTKNGFKPIGERVRVVKTIYKWAAEGLGSYTISRKLNETKVAPFAQKGGKGWQASYVTKILTNRAVLGEYQPHRLVAGKREPEGSKVADYYPKVIDDAAFQKAQRARASRRVSGSGRKGAAFTNLFSGLLTCGECSGRMHFINKGNNECYLICDNARRKMGCKSTSWNYKHFEGAFLNFVNELDLASLYNDAKGDTERQELKDKLIALNEKFGRATVLRDKVFELLELGTPVPAVRLKLDEAEEKIAKIRTSMDSTNESIQELDRRKAGFKENQSTLADLIARLQKVSGEHQFELRAKLAAEIHAIVGEVTLFPKGVVARKKNTKAYLNTLSLPKEYLTELMKYVESSTDGEKRFVTKFTTGDYRVSWLENDSPGKARVNEVYPVPRKRASSGIG